MRIFPEHFKIAQYRQPNLHDSDQEKLHHFFPDRLQHFKRFAVANAELFLIVSESGKLACQFDGDIKNVIDVFFTLPQHLYR